MKNRKIKRMVLIFIIFGLVISQLVNGMELGGFGVEVGVGTENMEEWDDNVGNEDFQEEVEDEAIIEVVPEVEMVPEAEKIPEEKLEVEKVPEIEEKPEAEKAPEAEEKPKVEKVPEAEEKPKVEKAPEAEEKPKVEKAPEAEEKQKVEKVAETERKPETKEKLEIENETKEERKIKENKSEEPILKVKKDELHILEYFDENDLNEKRQLKCGLFESSCQVQEQYTFQINSDSEIYILSFQINGQECEWNLENGVLEGKYTYKGAKGREDVLIKILYLSEKEDAHIMLTER